MSLSARPGLNRDPRNNSRGRSHRQPKSRQSLTYVHGRGMRFENVRRPFVNLGATRYDLDGVDDRSTPRVRGQARNQKCQCGSGRKYKHCHGSAK